MVVRVLLAEKSFFQRSLIYKMISTKKSIELIYTTRSAKDAIDKIKTFQPDVILLDIYLATRDDLITFKLIVENYPIPTIILSDITLKEMDQYTRGIVLKSFDYIVKPSGVWKDEIPKIKDILISKILNASLIKLSREMTLPKHESTKINEKKPIKSEILKETVKTEEFNYQSSTLPKQKIKKFPLDAYKIPITKILKTNIIVMGASVGGPKTLISILQTIPEDFPSPILVVQHMGHFFMRQFATTLKNSCNLNVIIPKYGEIIQPGNIYLSPGGKHMEIYVKNYKPCLRTFEGELINFCRPSVDVLFFSAAKVYGSKIMGILLTGMGKDGVAGLNAIKDAGGKTISESEETAILYGMPKVAAETGAAKLIVPSHKIKDIMILFAKKYNIT